MKEIQKKFGNYENVTKRQFQKMFGSLEKVVKGQIQEMFAQKIFQKNIKNGGESKKCLHKKSSVSSAKRGNSGNVYIIQKMFAHNHLTIAGGE